MGAGAAASQLRARGGQDGPGTQGWVISNAGRFYLTFFLLYPVLCLLYIALIAVFPSLGTVDI